MHAVSAVVAIHEDEPREHARGSTEVESRFPGRSRGRDGGPLHVLAKYTENSPLGTTVRLKIE